MTYAFSGAPSKFPSPHPGIINFFFGRDIDGEYTASFRPLIRGLSISSFSRSLARLIRFVSVPSSGDYQFLLQKVWRTSHNWKFPSPHPGIINFFSVAHAVAESVLSFRPLIRGLSISSMADLYDDAVITGFRPLIRGLSISSNRT